MMTSTSLLVWLYLGILTLAVDSVMIWRRHTGRLGETVRAEHQATTERLGGLRNKILLAVLVDLAVPPLALAACAFGYVHDRKRDSGTNR